MAEKLSFFTICSRNYLPYTRALSFSLRRQHPGADFTVLLADECDDVRAIEEFVGSKVILGRDLRIPTYFDLAMRYNIVEFNTALKPYGFQHLFALGSKAVVYLDPDLFFLRPLAEVEEAFKTGHQAVVTPHICEPLDMEHNPTELKLLRTGVYNLGFGAIANTDDGRAFVDWWASKMPTDCRVDLDAGLFVDQKFIDLMPSYLPRTKILRDPGYNVAYWNLAHRPLTKSEDGHFLAKGRPVTFMHFSGVRHDRSDFISVHQDRVSVEDLGEGRALFDDYRATLQTNRAALTEARIETDYAYGKFRTGEKIPPLLRTVYAKATPPQAATFEEVFDIAGGAFNHGVSGVTHENQHLISPIMADLWMRKPHLQVAFNIRDAGEAEAFALWFANTGYKEWDIDPAFVPNAVWELKEAKRTLSTRLALVAMNLIERGKVFSFLYPKSVRQAAVRWNRKVLPKLVRRLRSR